MAMSRLIGGSSSISTTRQYMNFTTFSYNTAPQEASLISKNKDLVSFSVHEFPRRSSLQYDPMAPRSFVVRNNITPPPLPSGSPSGSMRSWIVGIVLTFVLPFVTHKWGPLLVLKNKVDNVLKTTEYIMETMESVAERVDKVIDDITDDLPENSELRKTMEAVDVLVEAVAKSAHLANDIIDKVEDVENRLESLIIMDEEAKEEVPKPAADKQEIPTQESSD